LTTDVGVLSKSKTSPFTTLTGYEATQINNFTAVPAPTAVGDSNGNYEMDLS
jgi:hypothetical protein